jgi:DNA-binding XRE family transcriptional regulator
VTKAKPESGSQLFNRLAAERTERGVSRQVLADAMGINYQTVGYIERGDYSPSLELALRIADYFGLPVEALFSLRAYKPLSEAVYGNTRASERGDSQ